MSFAITVFRAMLFVLSILFGLTGLEAGPYTGWVDCCLFNSIMLNIMLLLDVCADGGEEGEVIEDGISGIHLAMLGTFVLIIIGTLRVYAG